MEPINIEKTIFIATKSRYELEVLKSGSVENARKKFRSKERWDYVEQSHIAQKDNVQKISAEFGSQRVIDRSQLTTETIVANQFFVSLGGDNQFTYCGQCILEHFRKYGSGGKYLLGTVLDPSKSAGALLYFTVPSLLQMIGMTNPNYTIDHWTCLEARVESSEILIPHPAVGDFFVGELVRPMMSRSLVYLNGKRILPEKSSGLLVVTGAGSGDGAWYDNVHGDRHQTPNMFAKDTVCAMIFVTEEKSRPEAKLLKGEVLHLESYNDDCGILVPDSHLDHGVKFDMGSCADIWLSDISLEVIKPL